jgi:hypothetical protein
MEMSIFQSPRHVRAHSANADESNVHDDDV